MRYTVYSREVNRPLYNHTFHSSQPEEVCLSDSTGKVGVCVYLFIEGLKAQRIESVDLTWTELRSAIKERLMIASRVQKLKLI